MSKYTTELRFICESKAGLSDSVGFNQIDDVISKSWNKIFDNFPIFDESYRSVLCSKILKHYYTREISAETVGLWQLWLNTRMGEIMPYYNKLYESALLESLIHLKIPTIVETMVEHLPVTPDETEEVTLVLIIVLHQMERLIVRIYFLIRHKVLSLI